MKDSKNRNTQIRIYIYTTKPYYYPGEKLTASILLDVFDKVKCDKLQVIAKGKIMIKAIHTSLDSDDEEDKEKNTINFEKGKGKKRKKRLKETHYDDTSSDNEYNEAAEISKKVQEEKELFKFKKIIKITNEEYLNPGKYSFPFELELPDNIPGTFLYTEKRKTYVEIAYSLKVKLNKVMIKEVIPIVIRQRESTFNYKRNNDFQKTILGCCCDNNVAKIKVSTPNKYYLSNEEVELNIIIDNIKNEIFGSPIHVELYQRIILFPKDKYKKIKITNLVGEYIGKKIVRPKKSYHKDISFHINKLNCTYEELTKTKAMKHYKHRDVITFLNSSVNNDFLICEYEAYSAVQYPNWNDEELGVFISVLVYPPIDGILSKSVEQIAKSFNNSIINKKIFLGENENNDDSRLNNYENEFAKKRFYRYDDGSAEKFKKKMLSSSENIKKPEKKQINDKNDNKEENIHISNNVNDFNNDKYNDKLKNINTIKKIPENNSINANINKSKQISDIDSTNSLQIKKNFNGDFLKDNLDNEKLDKDSFK